MAYFTKRSQIPRMTFLLLTLQSPAFKPFYYSYKYILFSISTYSKPSDASEANISNNDQGKSCASSSKEKPEW